MTMNSKPSISNGQVKAKKPTTVWIDGEPVKSFVLGHIVLQNGNTRIVLGLSGLGPNIDAIIQDHDGDEVDRKIITPEMLENLIRA